MFSTFSQSSTRSQWQSRNLTSKHLSSTLIPWQPLLPDETRVEAQKIHEGIVLSRLAEMCQQPLLTCGPWWCGGQHAHTWSPSPTGTRKEQTRPSLRQSKEITNSILFALALCWTDREAYLSSQHQPHEKKQSACKKMPPFQKRHCATLLWTGAVKKKSGACEALKTTQVDKTWRGRWFWGESPCQGSGEVVSQLQQQSHSWLVTQSPWGKRSGRGTHFPSLTFPQATTRVEVRISWWTHTGYFSPAGISTRKVLQTQEKQDASSAEQNWASRPQQELLMAFKGPALLGLICLFPTQYVIFTSQSLFLNMSTHFWKGQTYEGTHRWWCTGRHRHSCIPRNHDSKGFHSKV